MPKIRSDQVCEIVAYEEVVNNSLPLIFVSEV